MATNPGSLAPPPGLPSAPTLPPTSCCNHKYSPLQIGSATCRVLCLAGCVHCLPGGTPENPLPPSRGIQGGLNVEATRPRLPRSSERHPKPCVARHCFPTPRSAPGVWRACCKCVCRVDTSPAAVLTTPAWPDASAATPGDREAPSPPTTYAT